MVSLWTSLSYSPSPGLDGEGLSRLRDKICLAMQHQRSRYAFATMACVVTLVLGFSFRAYWPIGSSPLTSSTSTNVCLGPTIRREWRSLSRSEKTDYITAVKCLTKSSSTTPVGGTAHDEFAYVHSKTGSYCKTSISKTLNTFPMRKSN